MAIALNDIHRRTLAAWRAFQATPSLHAFMQPELRRRLESLGTTIAPLLILEDGSPELKKLRVAAETAFTATRRTLGRLHNGIRYLYENDEEILVKLAPLTLGTNESENFIRLTNLVKLLPTLEPKFLWPHDLKLADVERGLAEHRKSAESLKKEGQAADDALEKLRELRPEAEKLWADDDGGLDAWIRANVKGHEAQVAWGQERQSRPRKAEGVETKGAKSGKNKESKDASDKASARTPPGPGPIASGTTASPPASGGESVSPMALGHEAGGPDQANPQ